MPSRADWGNGLAQLYYKDCGDVTTTYPRWTNAVSRIKPVPPEGPIIAEKEGAIGNQAKRPEQKLVVWIMAILRKLSKPEQVGADRCAGVCAAAKACMMLPQHRRVI